MARYQHKTAARRSSSSRSRTITTLEVPEVLGLRAVALALLMTSAACGRLETSSGAHQELTVFAAASVREALEEAAGAFTRETGIQVRVATGPSSVLAAQIEQGAPAHLFLPASLEWSRRLGEVGLVDETSPLLGNRLVLVAPRGNPAHLRTPGDLLSANVRHVALAGEKVPAGQYAAEALGSLQLLEPLLARGKILRGQDVRSVVGFVERGEAEAGIVYATEAAAFPGLELVVPLPPETYTPVVYPLVLLKGAAGLPEVCALRDYLLGAKGLDAFLRRGFTAPEVLEPAQR